MRKTRGLLLASAVGLCLVACTSAAPAPNARTGCPADLASLTLSDTSERLLGATTGERRASCQVAPGLTFTAMESTLADGNIRYVRTLSVDFASFTGKVRATAGNAVKDREKTSTVARQLAGRGLRPLAAVNGGFFDISSSFAPGALGGLTVIDGKVLSSASNGEVALALGDHGRDLWIDKVWSQSRITFTPPGRTDRPSHVVDGWNREPGRIQGCGGGSGAAGSGDRNSDPADPIDPREPQVGIHCLDSDETVVFTPEFGPLPALPGIVKAVRVGANGTVRQVSDATRGMRAAPGEYVVVSTGADAAWLRTEAVPGARMTLPAQGITRGESAKTPVDFRGADDAVVNAGPWLVKNGAVGPFDFSAGTTPKFPYLNPKNARTAAGITAGKRLLLVEVDKKATPTTPAHGLTMSQMAEAMKNLGATQAVNLDGGGSSTMWVNGSVVSHPSDGAGVERAVGNSIVITAK